MKDIFNPEFKVKNISLSKLEKGKTIGVRGIPFSIDNGDSNRSLRSKNFILTVIKPEKNKVKVEFILLSKNGKRKKAPLSKEIKIDDILKEGKLSKIGDIRLMISQLYLK